MSFAKIAEDLKLAKISEHSLTVSLNCPAGVFCAWDAYDQIHFF